MSKRELARRPDQPAISPDIDETNGAGSSDPNDRLSNANEEMTATLTVSQMVNAIGRKGVQIGRRNRHGMPIFS